MNIEVNKIRLFLVNIHNNRNYQFDKLLLRHKIKNDKNLLEINKKFYLSFLEELNQKPYFTSNSFFDISTLKHIFSKNENLLIKNIVISKSKKHFLLWKQELLENNSNLEYWLFPFFYWINTKEKPSNKFIKLVNEQILKTIEIWQILKKEYSLNPQNVKFLKNSFKNKYIMASFDFCLGHNKENFKNKYIGCWNDFIGEYNNKEIITLVNSHIPKKIYIYFSEMFNYFSNSKCFIICPNFLYCWTDNRKKTSIKMGTEILRDFLYKEKYRNSCKEKINFDTNSYLHSILQIVENNIINIEKKLLENFKFQKIYNSIELVHKQTFNIILKMELDQNCDDLSFHNAKKIFTIKKEKDKLFFFQYIMLKILINWYGYLFNELKDYNLLLDNHWYSEKTIMEHFLSSEYQKH